MLTASDNASTMLQDATHDAPSINSEMQVILARFAEQIRAATTSGEPLRIRGGGSKDWYGRTHQGALPDALLDTRAYRGIVDYDPSELVVTARAGTPLAEVEQALASHGQMLPFEPPYFGGAATIGGCVAAGLSGPRRATVGSVRDFVLGVVMMEGKGQVLHFGGQVVKNVAGYDVSRLMAGSLGSLGLLLEVSLRTLPLPMDELTVSLAMSRVDAVRYLNEWAGRALPITASAWQDEQLWVRLGGARSAVQSGRAQLGGERLDTEHAQSFWNGLRDHTADFFSKRGSSQALWRVALPPTAKSLPIHGEELIEWGGGQRWYRSADDSARIHTEAIALGGHATLYHAAAAGPAIDEIFTRPAAPLMAIHQRLKDTFDPARIFNRGRLYPDF
jgi:glycolate oxidase FAD binding subunit